MSHKPELRHLRDTFQVPLDSDSGEKRWMTEHREDEWVMSLKDENIEPNKMVLEPRLFRKKESETADCLPNLCK